MWDGPLRARRVPRTAVDRLVRTAAGGLLLRSWFDDAALRLLTQWYFPLSRGWAEAIAAAGSVETFVDAVPCSRLARRLLPAILDRAEARRAVLDAANARWTEAFFGAGPASPEVEAERLQAAAALANLRVSLLPLHLQQPLPAIDWAVERLASVTRRHGHRLAHPDTAFTDAFDVADVEASRGFLCGQAVDGWVRFPSPVAAIGAPAWARVSAPFTGDRAAARPMPSLVFTHGIAIETEFTGDGHNPLAALVRAGVRVIRPEGPWHGRRRLARTYGGEPVLARGLGGLLDYFHAHVIEIGRLVAWARATRGGPVAVGGVSLGALTTQLVASVAHGWPPEMRPDALFLVAPSLSLAAVTFEGSLTRALGVPAALHAAGWTHAAICRWRPLLEPIAPPVVPADRIVVVLGQTDDVTLAAGGEALARAWDLPEQNVFRTPAGHFSTTLGLARDAAPLRRVLEVLRA